MTSPASTPWFQRHPARRWATVAAVGVSAGLVTSGSQLVGVVRDNALVMLILLGFVFVGEVREIRMPSGRVLAPLSFAAGMVLAALGSVHGQSSVHIEVGVIIALVGMTQAAALVVRRERWPRVGYAVARLAAISVLAVLIRIDGLDGASVFHWENLPSSRQTVVVLALVVVGALAVVVERLLAAVYRAWCERAPVASLLRDEVEEALPFTTTLLAPVPIATLAAPVLGVAAIGLALVPVAMTSFAVRRYAAIGETFGETVRTLSRLTEEGGYTPAQHAERVADLSRALALRLGEPERSVRVIEYAALLHDVGQLGLRTPIPAGATVLAAPHDQEQLAQAAADIVRHSPELEDVALIVQAQSTPHHQRLLAPAQVPKASGILKVANAFDDLTEGERNAGRISAAVERLHLGLGYEYDPAVVAALEEVIEDRWPRASHHSRPQGGST